MITIFTFFVQVVVMCQKAPTKLLFETVVQKLTEKLKEMVPDKNYKVLFSDFNYLVFAI
jgi:hypothetical protein